MMWHPCCDNTLWIDDNYKLVLEFNTCNFAVSFIFESCGIVFVTTTHSNMELFMRETAGPERIP